MRTGCSVEFFCVTCGEGRRMLAEEQAGDLLHLTCETCGESYDQIPKSAVERFEAACSDGAAERTETDTDPDEGAGATTASRAPLPSSLRREVEKAPEPPPEPAAAEGTRSDATLRRARAIAERHQLPLLLALHVAEGRMSLAAAQARYRKAKAESQGSPPGHGGERLALIASIAILAAALGALLGGRSSGSGSPVAPPAASAASRPTSARHLESPGAAVAPARKPGEPLVEIERTAGGDLAGVTAPTPEAVLVAYCRHAPHRCQQALGIGPSLPMRSHLRYGLYLAPSGEKPFRAIQIARERDTGRWRAGDGRSPIPTRPAPEYPDGVVIHPVSAGRR